LFFGYYAQVATMVADTGTDPIPELVRRICFEAPLVDPARVMADTLVRMSETIPLKNVLCDCGYSNRDPENLATPLRTAGAQLVMDLHPQDRGRKGSFEGAVIANGQLYCPATPHSLFELGPLSRGASKEQSDHHDQMAAELARYKLSAICRPDQEGYVRVRCPAAGEKCVALTSQSPLLSTETDRLSPHPMMASAAAAARRRRSRFPRRSQRKHGSYTTTRVASTDSPTRGAQRPSAPTRL
jgi:hypothetical protein